ncbi:NAD-dependent epimerase/dehydratase family protein [Flavobacterium pectinovorum]|uniref:NAD-dependent epimerase/dehydratase family protein n=1 Tax=Flavobacterium pectinovorum TaxID=29533 RepID=UPI001FAE0537|nr:NAD(P)-dependent oxidoreductase [Flavobacterium pectinovorum]MCI9846275.1 NAD(P)-dependent oxidoreductase [Flavobacterium pectinovorum]
MGKIKILITGGSGFIGTNLIETFLNEGKEVLSLDITGPKIESHNKIFKNVSLLDYNIMEKAILGFNPDYVIHLGARTDLNGKTLTDYNANIQGVENLLKVLDKLPSLKRVIFASSMYVCQPGYTPENYEDYKPHTVYGESKVMTEKIIKEKNPSYEWTIIRPTSIWGPYFGEPYNLFFKIVLSKKYFHMGSKACKKTYGYIDNFIYQLKSILYADATNINKKVFYLGDYEPYDITLWSNEIATERNIKIPNVPYSFFKVLGYVGDILKVIKIKFPMTSFRLKNMTTDNVYNLDDTQKIAPNLPFSRKEGTKKTVEWIIKE